MLQHIQKAVDHAVVLSVTGLTGPAGPAGTKPLFDGLHFDLPAGVTALTGDEGTGKTSLLRLLAGNLSAMSGSVSVAPDDVFWVDLQGTEHDQTTVQACWDALRPRYPRWNEELLQDLAEALDMTQHRAKRLEMLSTGSRRKVMVIAALASGATVTLLDQPFAALDLKSIRAIQDFLNEAAKHPSRAWIVADYEAPGDVPLASLLHL
ncbi:MAG: ATP-binding cassette domain-containing protein [Limnohabitans sp.]|jgi:ABC-type multidrug transport system ATPase subunit